MPNDHKWPAGAEHVYRSGSSQTADLTLHENEPIYRFAVELSQQVPWISDLESRILLHMRARIFKGLRGWLDAGVGAGRAAINAAAIELYRGGNGRRVLKELCEVNVPAHSLEVEVTKSVLLDPGGETVERALRTLSEAGVTIALNDFGTG